MNKKNTRRKNDHDITVNQHQITFSRSFDEPLRKSHIVGYCKHGAYYDKQTKCLTIPFNVTEMIFDDAYNEEVVVFPNINHLRFGYCFNQPIVLGANIITVHFGQNFDSLVQLNRGIVELEVGDQFDQHICLNKRLKKIKFGSCFDKPVLLNHDLEHISFDNCWYWRPISLGPNVKVLVLKSFNYIHKVFLTKRITHLTFADDNCAYIELPKHLKYLSLSPFMLEMVTLGKNLQCLKIFNGLSYKPMLMLEKNCCKNNDCFSIQMHVIQVKNNYNHYNDYDEWEGGWDSGFDDCDEPDFLTKYIVDNLSNGIKYKKMCADSDMIILNELSNNMIFTHGYT